MKKLLPIFFVLFLHQLVFSQASKIRSKSFFLSDSLVEVSLKTDIKNLRKEKSKPLYQPGEISMKFSDSLTLSGAVRLEPRGEYRKRNCDVAALRLNFKNPASPLTSLKKLKLVGGCRNGNYYEDLLLKEYMIYKIQNMLSDMSFRVRLIRITYTDTNGKVKPFTQYAFLMEDIDDLAMRNNCKEIKNKKIMTAQTDREHTTFVNLFEYMIGNTDWSIPNMHNMKFIVPKSDTLAKPYVIPYDYDYSGLVDAVYAVPAEALGIETVKTRLYRGFPRGLNELNTCIALFNEKKEKIMNYVDHFEICSEKSRNIFKGYLEQFYKTINDQNLVESIFIRNARVE